jgi:cytochrome P450
MLILAVDESGQRMNDKELRDEAMTLFFAGHETTAMALSWMWYLLAIHPEVEARLAAELESVVGARSPGLEDLPKLSYLDMVVKESMRILPSVWAYMREPLEDVRLGEHTIPKGRIAFISPYVTHHDPRFFPDPEAFRPERFSKEGERAIPKGAYVPFAAGPRVCLGKSFALMEARLILATMVQRVKVELVPGYRMELLPKISLRPKGGVPVFVRMRARPRAVEHAAAAH